MRSISHNDGIVDMSTTLNANFQEISERLTALENKPISHSGTFRNVENKDLLIWYGTEMVIDATTGKPRAYTSEMHDEILRRMDK